MTTSSARARSYRRVPAVLTLALSLTAVTSGAAQYPTSPPAAGPLREPEGGS